jgi:hypothetical protein
MIRFAIASFAASIIVSACSMEGKQVDGCIVHQSTSALAGVAWAECPMRTETVYLPGQATGWLVASSPIIGGVASGAGSAGAGLIVAPAIKSGLSAVSAAGQGAL